MWRTSLFCNNLIMTSYFSIIINIIIVTNPTCSRVLKIFIVLFSHHKFFAKRSFHYLTAISTFSDQTIYKIGNSSLPKYVFKGLPYWNYHQHILICSHNYKQYVFVISLYKTFLDFAFCYLLKVKNIQNLHKF